MGLYLGGPFHFERGLHVTITTVSVYGIYRYLTCLFSERSFLQKKIGDRDFNVHKIKDLLYYTVQYFSSVFTICNSHENSDR